MNKANATETIYYVGDTAADPATSGLATLAAYLQAQYSKGFRGVFGPVKDFAELPVKQWGYGMLAYAGELGSVWTVEIVRSLTPTRQYRQLNAATGSWIMDDWIATAPATPPQWYNVPLATGWTHITIGDGLKYGKDGSGNVWLRGCIRNAAEVLPGEIVATLPEGYRPSIAQWVVVTSSSNINRVFRLGSDGVVQFLIGGKIIASVDGYIMVPTVSFPAA